MSRIFVFLLFFAIAFAHLNGSRFDKYFIQQLMLIHQARNQKDALMFFGQLQCGQEPTVLVKSFASNEFILIH
jgi:hypothetical protein